MAIPTVKLTSKVKARIFAALIGAGVAAPSAYVATELTIPSESIVLVPHGDPVGLKTICAGHLVKKGEVVKNKYTVDECIDIFVKDWVIHEKLLDGAVKVKLSDGEKAAYSDFIFNAGIGNFKSSTLLKKLNAGDRVGACNELLKWKYAKGKELKGLAIRREKEQEVCLSGVKQGGSQ